MFGLFKVVEDYLSKGTSSNASLLEQGGFVNVESLLDNFDLDNLDPYESMVYAHAIKSMDKKSALQTIINTVEGDYSQLSDGLAKIAEIQYPQWKHDEDANSENYAKGGFVGKGELVWRKLTPSERMKFLSENFTPQITPRTQEILVGKSYNFLPKLVKIKFESEYANKEEFANGGGFVPYHKYALGDKYRTNFDYGGLFDMAKDVTVKWSISDLKKLSSSLESVNYHTFNAILEKGIHQLENNQIEEAEETLELFKSEISGDGQFASGGGVGESKEPIMTFEEFSKKLPDVRNILWGDRDGSKDKVYKAKYNPYSDRIAYFKNGRRNSDQASIATAYKTYILDSKKMANGGGLQRLSGEEIYSQAEKMSESEYEEILAKSSQKEQELAKRLERLGDDKKVALITAIDSISWDKKNYDSSTWDLHRYAKGGSLEYAEIKKEKEKMTTELFDKCGVFFAFSNEQFAENKTPLKEGEKYISIGAGGYMPKGNIDAFQEGMKAINQFGKKKVKDKNLAETEILYELNNHECFYTSDYSDVVDMFKGTYTEKQIRDVYNKHRESHQDYAQGGKLKYYNSENQHRLGRPSGSIEREILDKVTFKNSTTEKYFVGNFGWETPQGKLGDGYLFNLDEYDQNLVKDIKLKEGEKIFRYLNRSTAIGGMTPLIKINLDKELLYFANDIENDELPFSTKGTKALWIGLIQDKLANGGGIGEIDMKEIEESAKFYTDKSRWSTPPSIPSFQEKIYEYERLKTKLDNKEITPSKIIGTGYKPNYARPLAYKWLNTQILISKRAIELLKERG